MFLTSLDSKNKISGFTYIDVISGLTVILIILGAVFGSIRMMEKSTRQNALIPDMDSFANWIFEEINLRKFDENIESIEENGLTLNFGTETDENINNLSSLDDIDDFVGPGLTNSDFPQMEANVIINYVDVAFETSSISTSVNPTRLKRVKLEITHPSFDSPINYTKIFAGNFDPELLIIRSYPVSITVNRDADEIDVFTLGSSLTFTVEFSSEVFVTENDNFEFYIDIKSGVLAGSEGSYNTRPSNIGEVKASYLGGSGTRFLTFLLTNSAELQLSGSDLDDYIGYRPNLVIQNGSVRDIEGVEVLYGLPNEGEAASFTSSVNILPLLQQFNTKVYTTADELAFNRELAVRFVPQSARDIFNSWPRAERSMFWENKAHIDRQPPDWPVRSAAQNAAKQWIFYENPDRVNQPQNSSYQNHFISPDSLENYTFESTLFSSDGDDDVNGLVIAFDNTAESINCQVIGDHELSECIHPDIGNISRVANFLVVTRQTMGTRGNGVSWLHPKFAVYNLRHYRRGTSEIRSQERVGFVTIPQDINTVGWSRQYTRVKVVRDGDDISVWATPFQDIKPDPENPQYHPEPIELNLMDHVSYHKYAGEKRYGYTNLSQRSSQYYDNILSGGSLERRDVQILFDLDSGDVTKYYKKTDGDPIEQNVARLQSDIGYLRPLYNEETGEKYLLMQDGIIEYPFNED